MELKDTCFISNLKLLSIKCLTFVNKCNILATAYIRNMRYAIAIVLSSPIAVELYSIKELLGSK